MQIRPLSIDGAFEITPKQFGDPRGVFFEWFKDPNFFESVGHRLELAQANCSVSDAGVLRGVHFADVPPGQAKYVTCVSGAVLDVVVDIRTGSPTFGQWDSVLLDDSDFRAIYIAEGLGHAFLSLQDASTVVYLCSAGYSPGREHGINPLDPELGITWPTTTRDGKPLLPLLSDKDEKAPTLREAEAIGLLPDAIVVRDYLATLS